MSAPVFDLPTPLGALTPYHIGIATNDLEASMSALTALMGVSWTPIRSGQSFPITSPGRGLVADGARRTHSREGPLRMELLEGTPGSVWAPERQPHVHHVAYWTADVAWACRLLTVEGWTIELTTLDKRGEPHEFAYLTRADGLRVEVVDQAGRPAYLELVGAHAT
jgi:hypothetical protein